jgi:hypothetical protein
MVNTIAPLTGLPYNSTPWSNITPFTYRSARTFVEFVEDMRGWINGLVIPHINTEIARLVTEWNANVDQLIEDVNGQLETQNGVYEAFVTQVEAFIATLDAAVTTATNAAESASADAASAAVSAASAAADATLARLNVEVVTTELGLTAAIARIVTAGGGIIRVPNGVTIDLTATVTFPNEVRGLILDGALRFTTNNIGIQRQGTAGDTIYNVTANVTAGERTITVTDTTGLAVSDWVLIASTDVLTSTTDKIGYMRRIRSLTGTTLTFDTAIPRNMVNDTNRRLRKINMAAPFKITGTGEMYFDAPATKTVSMIWMLYVDGFEVHGVKLHDGGSRCIRLSHSVNFHVNCRIDNFIDDIANTHVGYGVDAEGATRDGIVEGLITRCRHAFTTNVGPSLPEFGFYGEPENITVRPVTAQCTDKALDTHRAGWGIKLTANDTGSGGVVQVRADNVFIESVVANGNYSSAVIVVGSVVTVPPVIGPVNVSYGDGDTVYALSPAILTAFPRKVGGSGVLINAAPGVTMQVAAQTIVKAKSALQTVNNSVVFVDDDTLFFDAEPDARYLFDVFGVYRSAAAADITFGWTYPVGAIIQWTPDALDLAASSPTGNIRRAGLFQTDVATIGGIGATTDAVAKISGRISTGVNGGRITLQWRQGTADVSDTQMRSGSYLRITRYQ